MIGHKPEPQDLIVGGEEGEDSFHNLLFFRFSSCFFRPVLWFLWLLPDATLVLLFALLLEGRWCPWPEGWPF